MRTAPADEDLACRRGYATAAGLSRQAGGELPRLGKARHGSPLAAPRESASRPEGFVDRFTAPPYAPPRHARDRNISPAARLRRPGAN